MEGGKNESEDFPGELRGLLGLYIHQISQLHINDNVLDRYTPGGPVHSYPIA